MLKCETVYLVDGEPSSRRLLSAQLGRRGFEVWPFDSMVRFLAVIDTLRPSCIVLDIGIEAGRGIDLIANLRELTGGWPVIALYSEPDVATAVAAVRAGAEDFLEKECDSDRIDRALKNAFALLHRMLEAAGDREDSLARLARLTPREKEVALSLLGGLSNKRTAYLLGISVRTVEMHRGHVMAKLGVRNMAEAAVLLAGIGFGDARGRSVGARPRSGGGSSDRPLEFAA